MPERNEDDVNLPQEVDPPIDERVVLEKTLTRNKAFLNALESKGFLDRLGLVVAICFAKIEHRNEEVFLPRASIIQLPSSNLEGRRKLWFLDLSLFEPVHGISRVLRLIPDKLATALAINDENLPNHQDDGRFLIDLVLQLQKLYLKITSEKKLNNENKPLIQDNEKLHILTLNLDVNDEFDFFEVEDDAMDENEDPSEDDLTIQTFLTAQMKLFDGMTLLKDLLAQRNRARYLTVAEELLETSDSMLIACHVFLDFIHPLWINVNRSTKIEGNVVNQLNRKLGEKLESLKDKLSNEFDGLMNKADIDG